MNRYIVILIILLAGCSNFSSPTLHEVTIANVEVLTGDQQKSTGDGGFSGAVVGGMMFGTAGAVIGSTLDDKKTWIEKSVISCRLTFKWENKTIGFIYTRPFLKENCASLKPGDIIAVHFVNGAYKIIPVDTGFFRKPDFYY